MRAYRVSLFDHVSGAATAPPITADSLTRSQWLTRDAAARLAIRNHLPITEYAHVGQHRTAQALYDAVVARYSSPATAALGRLLLPYLFPKLSTFAPVEDLVSHLRASDARYRAAAPAEFLDTNQPPMFITLYFIVTRLPDSLRSVRDHFLSLDPTSLTVDLLVQHLLAAETSAIAVGAARGTPRPPFFEGCSPFPLAPSYASAAAADVSVPVDVGAASTSGKRRSSKGKGGRGGGGGSSGGGGGSGSGSGGSGGGGGGGGTVGGSGGSGGSGGGSGGSGTSGGGGTGSGGTGARLIRTGDRAGKTCGRLHTQHRGFSRLDNAWRAEIGDDVELPRWADLLKSRIAIFDLDIDAIVSAMYALSVSAEGDCYRCVPPDPGTAAAGLGASESGTLPGTAIPEALHTFTLDSGASRCFFRDSTTLTPLPAPLPVRLADPSGGPVVACSSTVLSCPAHSQHVSICTCTWTRRHLATFTRRPGSSLYTLTTDPSQVVASAQVSVSSQVAASCSCRLLSHQTLLWHHRLGHSSLPRLRGMHSHFLVSGLLKSLPPLPPSPAPPCLPCVEGRQSAAPHSSFPPTIAPLQTLHMDVWGPARVSGQSCECYFLLVVDDYTRYTTVFPLHSKGQVIDVLIPWIRTVRLQLREHFGQDLPVLRLHSDRGGEFSSNHCGSFLNLWPRVSLPETSPTLRWTGEVGDASVFWVWGSRAFDPDMSADKLSSLAIPCSVPFYRLFPYRSAPPQPPPLFLAPGPPPVDPLPPQGPAPSGVSQVHPLPGPAPIQVAVDLGAARGAASGGVEPGGAESEGTKTGGAKPRGGEPGGAEPGGVATGGEGAESGGEEPRGAASSGASGAGGTGAAGNGGPRVASGAGVTGGSVTPGPGGARTRGTEAAGTGGVEGSGARAPTEPGATGAGGTGAGGARTRGAGVAGVGAVDPGARGPGGTVRPRPYFVPLLQRVLGVMSSTPPLLCPPPDQSQLPLQPASPLPAPSPYTEQSTTPPLVAESASASPLSVGGECALGTDVLEDRQEDFESLAAAVPRFASMLLAPEGNLDALDIPTPCAEAITVDCMWIFRVKRPPGSPPAFKARYVARGFSQRQGVDYFQTFSPTPKMTALRVFLHVAAQRDYELHSLDFSTAFLQGSLHEEIWLRRPPGLTEPFPAGTQWSLRRPVYCLCQAPRKWHDTLRTTLAALGFAPATADPSLFQRTDISLPPFYVLVYIDDLVFAIADTEALTLVKLELQKRHTCTDLGELRNHLGLQITRERARRTFTLTQSHMMHQVLQRFDFHFSSPQPTPLSTSHSLSAPPSNESVEPSVLYPELVGCLMYLMTCTQPDLAYPLSLLAHYVAPGRHRKVHWDAAKRVVRYLCSTCEAEIYTGAMAAQELRWLTYLLTNLGERPCSPPILYVDNKAMIALCQEHRLEHRTKHIPLRYFLARELQQRGQLRLVYVAIRANM
ncbi:unnamed protein product [Closterium sp. NIES-54]